MQRNMIGNVIRVYPPNAPQEYVDCLLAQVEPHMVCAICIDTGNRMDDPCFVRNTMNLTDADMDRILGQGACFDLLKEAKHPKWLTDMMVKLKPGWPF
jgi:hypothetical protein